MYPNFFVCFDLETGGLIRGNEIPPITEIAMVVVDNHLNDVMEYSTLIKPYVEPSKYTKEALNVSNITLEMCETKGIEASVAAKQIVDVLKKAKLPSGGKKPILVGHNIDSFDIPILDFFLSSFKQDLSKVAETACTVDTKWWGRLAYPELSGYTLSDCLTKEGIDNAQSHRALGDTRANKELFVNMMKKLRGEAGLFAGPDTKEKFRKNFRFQFAKK